MMRCSPARTWRQRVAAHARLRRVVLARVVVRAVDHDRARDALAGDQRRGALRCRRARSSARPRRRAGRCGDRGCRAVWMTDTAPSSLMPTKMCGWRAEIIALSATRRPPSVPFLKPTGIDRPLAISRCVWLSVVRAPIAAQLNRSAMYCGTIGSSSSLAQGRPSSLMSSRMRRASSQAGGDVARAVEVRVVDQALPADRRARLLEVGAHDDHELIARRVGDALAAARRSRAPRAGSWIEHGPTIATSRRRSRPCRTSRIARRASSTTRGGRVGQRQLRFTARGETNGSAAARLRSSIGSVCCIGTLPSENKKAPRGNLPGLRVRRIDWCSTPRRCPPAALSGAR